MEFIKVVCISNESAYLVKNNIYLAKRNLISFYDIHDLDGKFIAMCYFTMFETLSDYRDKRIDDILND